jgi:hypothetical protein
MKKLLALAAVLALMAGSARADLRVFGSYWDAGDLNEGYGGGAGMRFELLPFLGLELRGSYLDLSDVEMSLIPLEGAVILQLPGHAIVPYVGAGAGYYMFDADKVDPDDDIGLFALAGLEVGAAKGIRFFAEARWVALETSIEGASDVLESLGEDEVSVDGLGVNAGLVWDW